MENVGYTAFADDEKVVSGPLAEMLEAVKDHVDGGDPTTVLIFEDHTGRQVDFDFRGSLADVLARAAPAPQPRKRGRPRLGVETREISLLPRHWDWLRGQPNGSSAALRRLVDEERKRDPEQERARRAREAVHRFMTAMAGERPNYEEALRALFAGEKDSFEALTAEWPVDIRDHLQARAAAAFPR